MVAAEPASRARLSLIGGVLGAALSITWITTRAIAASLMQEGFNIRSLRVTLRLTHRA